MIMKKLLYSTLFILSGLVSSAQCSTVSVQISSSDTSLIQLYNAGIFNLDSGYANVVIWEVTDFAGGIVHQDTTSGVFNDQSFSLFNHSVALTDSMRATIEITNGVTGEVCFIEDTLFWEETEVIPGVFIGNWAVLNDAGGVVTGIDAIANRSDQIQLYPSLVDEQFTISGNLPFYSLRLISVNGQQLETFWNVGLQEPVNIAHYQAGIYLVQFLDEQERVIDVKRIVKR